MEINIKVNGLMTSNMARVNYTYQMANITKEYSNKVLSMEKENITGKVEISTKVILKEIKEKD